MCVLWYTMDTHQEKTMALRNTDRHHKDSVQLKAWVPRDLRERFRLSCQQQGVPAASVLRDMIEAYCAQAAAGAESGELSDGQD